MSSTISVASSDGRHFDAYLTLPPAGPAPAIVIVPSIFGVTDGFKTSLDRYTSKGFIVIAPDVFWRTHPGPLTGDRIAEGQARMKAYDFDEGLDDPSYHAESARLSEERALAVFDTMKEPAIA